MLQCCDGNCPPCEKPCARTLRCGNHKCTSVCHCGPCYPCPLTAEVKCRCGLTVLSVPCGRKKQTRPPHCNKPCRYIMFNYYYEWTYRIYLRLNGWALISIVIVTGLVPLNYMYYIKWVWNLLCFFTFIFLSFSGSFHQFDSQPEGWFWQSPILYSVTCVVEKLWLK
jgi:hypothetical protein